MNGYKSQPWNMSIGEFFRNAVRENSMGVFIEILEEKITYQECFDRSLQTAAMFREFGITKGDRVALFLPNCPEFLYCWFGLSMIGAISVPINTAYKKDETFYILDNSDASAFVAHQALLSVAVPAGQMSKNLKAQLYVLDGNVGGLETTTNMKDWKEFYECWDSQPSGDLDNTVLPDDISMLVYTSGTTGNPKGVQVTHLMYVAAGQGFAYWTHATSRDRFFTCLPYFHANAQYYSTMGTMAAGATLIVESRFSASRFWSQVKESRATVVNFIGMMMPVLSKQPSSHDDRENEVRLFYGSPAFSKEFLEEFQERFGTQIIVGFGMTETCYGTIEELGDSRRSNSSGLPRKHPDEGFVNQLKIADELGNGLPTGQVGEISIKNPAITPGYWRNEEQSRLSLRDGWLYTGDLGWLDEDGYLYFVDRKKDVIRRRGENISSQEVEDVIKRHASVLDCAVIAVPSDLGEDEVKAYVLPRDGIKLQPEDIIYWCADNLAYFKCPRYIELREDLPRTPSLRVRKDVLRQERDDLVQGCFDREQAGIVIR